MMKCRCNPSRSGDGVLKMVALLLSVAAILLASDPSGVEVAGAPVPLKGGDGTDATVQPAAPLDDEEDWSGDDEREEIYNGKDHVTRSPRHKSNRYEAKMEQALAYYASKSQNLINRALQGGGALKPMEVGPDGNVLQASSGSGSVEGELWKVEFTHAALIEEFNILVENLMEANDLEEDDMEILTNDQDLKKDLDRITDDEYRQKVYKDIKTEWKRKLNMDPEDWHTFSYWELHAYFSCARVFVGSRPVYDQQKWRELRDLWHAFHEKDRLTLEDEPERMYQRTLEAQDFPLEPFQSEIKGRSLKAEKDISEGELIFRSTNNTIIFTDGHTWRKFLFAINERNGEDNLDDATTCDVLIWSWVQKLVEDGPEVIVMDLDNTSLLNEGRDEPGWESPNVRCGKEGDSLCGDEYYATKDIKKGDELLCDYRGFAMLDSWPDMGL